MRHSTAVVVFAVLSVLAHPIGAQAPSASQLNAWARPLAGTWSCQGAFANGRPLAADIELAPVLGGKWLSYHHMDRAPGQYEASALLGPASTDSAPAPSVIHDNFGGRRRFLTQRDGDEVTLLRDTTEAKARLERFRFRARGEASLWFAWEVWNGRSWALGDSLACTR